MKPFIQFKQAQKLLLIPLMLTCFELLPQAQAQTNTAYGNGALVSLTSGVWNSGFGFEALNHDTAGSNNTATGLRSLFSDTNGSYNSANGVYEFLKEHRKVEELQATVAHQRKDFQAAIAHERKEMETVVAQLKEQAAQIQKVSAQLEMSKPAPSLVVNQP